MSPLAHISSALVRFYQVVVSPLTGPCCRYDPTCSHYAIEAIKRHGALKGCWLAARRIVRCAPWGGHGLDPVPEEFSWTGRHHASGCAHKDCDHTGPATHPADKISDNPQTPSGTSPGTSQ